MSEYGELVKRLREVLQADLASTSGPIKGSIGMLAVMPFPQFDRIADERREAAQAIERLEGDLAEAKELLAVAGQQIKLMTAGLADARTEIERMRDALELVLPMAKGYAAAHKVGANARYIEAANEALATPAPGKNEKAIKP